MTVPDDLVRWFAGKQVLADRHNLPRIRGRWRVVEVLGVLGEPDDPWIAKSAESTREFRTERAANRYRDRLARRGAVVLVQRGVIFWPDPDEWPTGGTPTEPTPARPKGLRRPPRSLVR